MINFFILHLINGHPRVYFFFILWPNQQSSRNVQKNFFWRNIRNFFTVDFFCFQALQVPSRNIRIFFLGKNISFLRLTLESSISQNAINFFKVGFFIFRAQNSLLKFFNLGEKKFHFPKCKKSFF